MPKPGLFTVFGIVAALGLLATGGCLGDDLQTSGVLLHASREAHSLIEVSPGADPEILFLSPSQSKDDDPQGWTVTSAPISGGEVRTLDGALIGDAEKVEAHWDRRAAIPTLYTSPKGGYFGAGPDEVSMQVDMAGNQLVPAVREPGLRRAAESGIFYRVVDTVGGAAVYEILGAARTCSLTLQVSQFEDGPGGLLIVSPREKDGPNGPNPAEGPMLDIPVLRHGAEGPATEDALETTAASGSGAGRGFYRPRRWPQPCLAWIRLWP